jgi:3-oxo-5alpha-steroid 4-dehydrogenase
MSTSDKPAVLPPLTVASSEDVAWDETTDVLVVGFGGAGACAALQARESGAEVIAIDRFSGGGATAYSGGVIYAGDTRFQREAGFTDSAEAMYDYLAMEVGDVVRPETLRRYCNESAANLEWLMGHGVPYASDTFLEKTIYPPDGKFLYYSGNEKVPEYAAKTPPVPRGHRAVGDGMSGFAYYRPLAQSAERLGVKLGKHERAVRLIQDASGRVIGVETARIPDPQQPAHQKEYDKVIPMLPFKATLSERAAVKARELENRVSETRRIRARGGVILSTGGFALNLKMLHRHRPFLADNYKSLMRLASLGCDGSGIELGQSVGGATDRMDAIYAARIIAPPNSLLHGILINQMGERFINEEAYSGFIGLAIGDQPEGKAWLVMTSRSFRAAIKEALTSGALFLKYYGAPALLNFLLGGTRRAGSLAALARKCGIDPATLERTGAEVDAGIASGTPDPFGKSDANRERLGDGNLVAVNFAITNHFAFSQLFTLGGLMVDEDSGHVLDRAGQQIAGLYAAGRAAVGLCSNGYISGMSIGDGMFSGRRAARSAARGVNPA